MNLKSTYVVECVCGEKFNSETTQCTCPKCGVEIEIQWRAL